MYNKLWIPNNTHLKSSTMAGFMEYIHSKNDTHFSDYEAFHLWSIENLGAFWEAVVDYFKLHFDSPYKQALLPAEPFYLSRWFEGATLSYTAHITRNFKDQQTALIFQNESGVSTNISWNALLFRAAQLKEKMLQHGVKKGDRVVGYLLNHPDTIASFLAVNALGAIWSCCSPDFGIQSVINRFEQLEPKLLLAHENYSYNGKTYQQQQKINTLKKGLPSLKGTLLFSGGFEDWDLNTKVKTDLHPIAVPFAHPIWTLFSSGTTGKPKAITHSTGGMLLEQVKALSLHQNVQEGDRFFWNTTTGWMMWNYALGSLLCGGVLCLYDGAANYPDLGQQWRFAMKNEIQHFGNGAPYYSHCMKNPPKELTQGKFKNLKTLGATGAPLSSAAFEFLQHHLPTTQIISLSGGTDVCSAFIGGNPMLPVYAGYLQCLMLGAAISSWDASAKAIVGETGELVITAPMPSMPIYFWGDENYTRYHQSYFERFPKVWAHGDWIKIQPGIGIEVLGRSDATLNKNGIRIGTAEIYSALESFSGLKDSLIVDLVVEGQTLLVLFVVQDGVVSKETIKAIEKHLRANCSPRHVPDLVFQVPEIPYTISGKKMEIPVKRLLMGKTLQEVASPGAMKNPKALEPFLKLKSKLTI